MNYTQISSNNFKRLPWFSDLENWYNCVCSGGEIRDCILGQEGKDVDIFGTKENLDLFKNNNLSHYKKIYHDEGVLETYSFNNKKVQLVYREYLGVENLLSNFDFTICQFSWAGSQITCNPESLVHLYEKKLIFNKLTPEFIFDSFRRLQKYIQYGYTLCNGGMKTFIEEIRKVEEEVLKNNISFYPNGEVRIIRWD